jgi:hypothetical protein
MQAIQQLRQLFGRYDAGRACGRQTRELRFIWRCLSDAGLIPRSFGYEGLRHHLRDPASYTIRSPGVVLRRIPGGVEPLDERHDAIERIADSADEARTLAEIPDNNDAAWQRAARAAETAPDPWELPKPVDGRTATAKAVKKILTERGL